MFRSEAGSLLLCVGLSKAAACAACFYRGLCPQAPALLRNGPLCGLVWSKLLSKAHAFKAWEGSRLRDVSRNIYLEAVDKSTEG